MDEDEKPLVLSLANGLVILAYECRDGFRVEAWKDLAQYERDVLVYKLVDASAELRLRRFRSKAALIEAVLREARRRTS